MSARSRHPHLVAWACRLYGVVVWTYPAGLRHDARRELLLTFKNQTEDVFNSGGVASVMLFVLHIATDWLRTLTSEPEDPMTLSLLGLGAREGEGAAASIGPRSRWACCSPRWECFCSSPGGMQ
jgi:hypothetical protein